MSSSAAISSTCICSCRTCSRSSKTQSSYQPGSKSPQCRREARSAVATEQGWSMIRKATAIQFLMSTSTFSARDSSSSVIFSTPRAGPRSLQSVVRSRAPARSSGTSGHNAPLASSRRTVLRTATNATSRWTCSCSITCCSWCKTNPSKRHSLSTPLMMHAHTGGSFERTCRLPPLSSPRDCRRLGDLSPSVHMAI